MRIVAPGDGAALAAALTRNASHLSPWEPERGPDYATPAGQESFVAEILDEHARGLAAPWAIVSDGQVIGQATVSHVVYGPFLSGSLGYWLDAAWTGRGIMTRAVETAAAHARDTFGLHRLQAATLVTNTASQAVLTRAGFTRIGIAERYLKIAGTWQDHVVFQRLLE